MAGVARTRFLFSNPQSLRASPLRKGGLIGCGQDTLILLSIPNSSLLIPHY